VCRFIFVCHCDYKTGNFIQNCGLNQNQEIWFSIPYSQYRVAERKQNIIIGIAACGPEREFGNVTPPYYSLPMFENDIIGATIDNLIAWL
jgi:hypothetical protein